MKPLRPIQTLLQDIPTQLPKRHKYGLVLLSGFIIASATMMPAPNDLVDQPIKIRLPASLHLPKEAKPQVGNTEFFTLTHDEIGPVEPVDALDIIASDEPEWQEYVVQRGDTLSSIFNGLGLPLATMYTLLEADKARSLHGINPGQTLTLLIDADNQLQQLKIKRDLLHTRIFSLVGDHFESKLETEESNWEARSLSGVINGSFYISGRNAGLSATQIQRIANLFQWQMDFSRDLKQGDTFKVVVEREFVNGQSTGKSELKAAQITNRGKTLMAFRSEDGKFYNEKGESLERGFIRTPLERNARISSNYNLTRRHPVTGRVQPHNGTDFAVPVGTPVIATGDGVVVKATRHPLAGNYLVIRHGRQYTTRFLHLSRFLVKEGDKVKRGQRIALSGNTGRSTGAHLHYEFHVNNRPVDPRQVKLPMAEGLNGSERQQFLSRIEQYKRSFSG